MSKGRHPGMIAFGIARAMAEGRRVLFAPTLGADFEADVIRRSHDEAGAATANSVTHEPREGKDFSSVYADVRLDSGAERRVWVNELEGLLLRGGDGT